MGSGAQEPQVSAVLLLLLWSSPFPIVGLRGQTKVMSATPSCLGFPRLSGPNICLPSTSLERGRRLAFPHPHFPGQVGSGERAAPSREDVP